MRLRCIPWVKTTVTIIPCKPIPNIQTVKINHIQQPQRGDVNHLASEYLHQNTAPIDNGAFYRQGRGKTLVYHSFQPNEDIAGQKNQS